VNVREALTELRKEENKRKFEQSVDLIVNLKGLDMRKDNVNAVITIPHKIKDKKVCGFFEARNKIVKTITLAEFDKYGKDKKLLKNLIKDFDFFVASAPLMPRVATTFGKVLGPVGKMPSPQLGILPPDAKDEIVNGVLDKIAKSVKVKMKEASIKIVVGREGMKDDEIAENFEAVYRGIVNALPNKIENVRNVAIKLTMSKPIKVEVR